MKVHRSRSVRRAAVMADGKNLVSHAGTALLAELADRSGLTHAMSVAMARLRDLLAHPRSGRRAHPSGGRHRRRCGLLGRPRRVARNKRISSARWPRWRPPGGPSRRRPLAELRAIPMAVAEARARVWAAVPAGGPITVDFDATLSPPTRRSKTPPPPTSSGFGFHPLGVWCDNTAEPLAAMLRPGNAGSNDADDHLELLEAGHRCPAARVPPRPRRGRRPLPRRPSDPGAAGRLGRGRPPLHRGSGPRPTATSRSAFPSTAGSETPWSWPKRRTGCRPVEQDGNGRDGASVIELTDLVDLSSWPWGMRLFCRRERPHPGAQLTLFDTSAGFRHTCFVTANTDARPRRARATPPGPRPGRGPGAELEGLRACQPALRRLLPQPGVGGRHPRRRRAARLEPDCCASTASWPRPSPRPCASACPARRGQPRPPWPASRTAPRRALAVGERARRRLHATAPRLPVVNRVPAPDPKAKRDRRA